MRSNIKSCRSNSNACLILENKTGVLLLVYYSIDDRLFASLPVSLKAIYATIWRGQNDQDS
jgi:hypothetical protein